MTKSYPIIGTKSSLLLDETTDAWTYISGEPQRKEDPSQYWKIVPTLYRGVDMRAKAVASMPWALMRGETEVDSSANFENFTGLVSSMSNMFYLIEASLVLSGRAYWKREQNVAGYDKLRHLRPDSLQLDEDRAINGELFWNRNENGRTKEYSTKEIIYMWYLDPYVEIGPPSSWPVQSALSACGVLANIDEFAKTYFARGAIKAMIFSMQGATRQDAEEFETWWQRWFSGLRNVFRTKVINAEHVSPVIVGEGIKELENTMVTDEKRREIAVALGVPFSLLFSDASNYATAQQDKLNWYEDVAVPECKFIADFLNDQVFTPLGLTLKFLPETLDIFQQDEADRSAAMSSFIDAMVKAQSFEMAQAMFSIFGYEISDAALEMIAAHFAKAEENQIEQRQQYQYQFAPQTRPTEAPQVEAEETEVKRLDNAQLGRELSIWQSKCIKAIERGEAAVSVSFVPVATPLDVHERIMAGLKSATDSESVKAVFAGALVEDAPQVEAHKDGIGALVEQLKRQNDIFIWKGYP